MKNKYSFLKALSLFVIVVAASLFFFKESVFAEAMTGQVLSVNPQSKSVTVEKMSPSQEMGEKITIHMKEGTTLNGFNDLEELEVGEEVALDASRQFFFGPWQADKISRQTGSEAVTADAEVAAEPSVEVAEDVVKQNQEAAADLQENLQQDVEQAAEEVQNLPTGQELMERQSQSAEKENIQPAAPQ